MVAGVNTTDNPKTSFNDFMKKNHIVVPFVKTNPIPNDAVVINNNAHNSTDKMNKLQIASLILGSLVSVAFLVILGRNIIPARGNKALLKQIKKSIIPTYVKDKLAIEYSKMRNGSAESLNYINNVTRLKWDEPVPQLYDIEKARQILDEELVGMEKAKSIVIKSLTVRNYQIKNGIDLDEPLVFCLDGPPGVGKTSIAEVIAKVMDKSFQRISLGGVSDKTFVKGAKRVYKDSEPGAIIKAMQNAQCKDPVILLDELDKMGNSKENGSPAAALLDVLESKQCKNFTDEYLEMPYDLSKVTFVMSSNDLNGISKELRDRIKIIKMDGYTPEVKKAICKRKSDEMVKKFKLDSNKIEFSPEAISGIVSNTNDLGARKTLEKLKDVFYDFIAKIELGKIKADKTSEGKIIIDKRFVDLALANT